MRTAESVMVEPKEVAYTNEGPTVVLRRMRQAGLSHIFVVDSDRRLVGLVEAEEVARLTERNERGSGAPSTRRAEGRAEDVAREVLPLFVDDSDAPVAVVDEEATSKAA